MDTLRLEQRREIGCGWEPPLEGAHPWRPLEGYVAPRDADGKDVLPSVCIGYSKQLAETQEVLRAYPHWEKGALRDYCGRAPSRALMHGIEVLHASVKTVESFVVARAERRRKAQG
ncbi:MAG TPA: hypothetical protein VL199_09715 [Burkholderiales bacterium]|nr:hypothetical protein [Burkholderiales bacterium]